MSAQQAVLTPAVALFDACQSQPLWAGTVAREGGYRIWMDGFGLANEPEKPELIIRIGDSVFAPDLVFCGLSYESVSYGEQNWWAPKRSWYGIDGPLSCTMSWCGGRAELAILYDEATA